MIGVRGYGQRHHHFVVRREERSYGCYKDFVPGDLEDYLKPKCPKCLKNRSNQGGGLILDSHALAEETMQKIEQVFSSAMPCRRKKVVDLRAYSAWIRQKRELRRRAMAQKRMIESTNRLDPIKKWAVRAKTD